MSRIGIVLKKYVGRLFERPSDTRVIDSINLRNIRNVLVFSVITGFFDAITLILYSATSWNSHDFFRTFFNVAFCVIVCLAVAILSKAIIRKYENSGVISNVNANILVILFYVLLSAWAIMVDVTHYKAGDQMLTFYIVQFCFVCFVVMPPRLGSILIALSFLVLYLSLYFADGAVGIQPQNYALFGLIAVFGNAFQYMRVRETEKRRVHILELNQILRQEASIDDLTKLKNRNALRNDFDRYTGRYIYAIMADIDHFKSYNDAYGHVVGDEVLGRVAAATKEAFSNGDAYRYGGDEFLIILADRTEEEFNGSIASWREAVRSVQAPGISHPITCSFGYIRCFIKNADDLRDAIKAADDHLYEVKKAKLAMSPTL